MLKSAFVKLYDHAEDSGMDKLNLYEEDAEASVDYPYLFRKITMAEFDRLGYDEEYKAFWLAGYNRQNGLDGHVPTREFCTPS